MILAVSATLITMPLFHVIEFRNEENYKSRGPFVISSLRIRKSTDTDSSSEFGTVAVKWDVVDSLGNRKVEYYDGECLMVGTKNDCGLFIDRLKANREQAAINNKEGRTQKNPTNYSTTQQIQLKKAAVLPKSQKE